MALTVDAAISRLNEITTKEQLLDLIGQVDVESPGKVTMLYSGEAPSKGSTGLSARDIVLSMAFADDNIRIVDKTEAGRFLDINEGSLSKNVPLIDAIKRIFGDSPDVQGSEAYHFLFGDVIDGKRVPNGAWDLVSERFVAATTGEVRTITGGAHPDRAFAQTELPAILRSDGVTSVDGIPIDELKTKTPQQAFEAIRAQSEVRSAELRISVDADGKPLHVDGTIQVDTRNFFADSPDIEGTMPDGDSRMRPLADFIPPERLQQHIQGIEELRKTKEHLNTQLADLTVPDSHVVRLRILQSLDRLGTAADVLSLALVAMEAQAAYATGDIDKSRKLLGDWIVENVSAMAAGHLASLALAPLFAAGPPGMILAGALTIMASMVGANYGDDVWKWLLQGVQGWDDAFREQMAARFILSQYEQSPLILDLNGDGIFTLATAHGHHHFDHDGNRYAEKTGWVTPGDGLLVRDLNSDGLIDSGAELFGNNTLLKNGSTATDGFQALKDLDSNLDGVIDQFDAVWSELLVWQDADSDATVDPGELMPLDKADVRSVGLANSPAYEYNGGYTDEEGNFHKFTGSYRTTHNIVRTVEDVWFAVDLSDTVSLDQIELAEGAAILPEIDGMGNIPSLRQAMAADTTGVLPALLRQWIEADSKGRAALMEPILMHWAGVQNLSRSIDLPKIKDARRLAVLERFLSRQFQNHSDSAGSAQANRVDELFNATASIIHTYLYANVEVAPLLQKLTTTWNPQRGVFELDGSAAIESMRARNEEGHDMQGQIQIALALKTVLPQPLRSTLLAEFQAAAPLENWSFGSFLLALGADRLHLGSEDQPDDFVQDYTDSSLIDGASGNDSLYGGPGDDTLYGGAGDDLLADGEGQNTFVFGRGDGHDEIQTWHWSNDTADKILQFWGSIQPDEVHVSTSNEGANLSLVISNTTDRVEIRDFVRDSMEGPYPSSFHRVQFADGTMWEVQEILSRLFAGSPLNDYLKGSTSADSIRGAEGADTIAPGLADDTLVGGAGDDFLFGGEGSDAYLFARGDGHDRIVNADVSSAKQDSLVFAKGILPGDLTTSRVGQDLLIAIKGASDSILVKDYFLADAASPARLEEIRFASRAIWTVDTVKSLVIAGKASAQKLIGYATSDVILAEAGNDTVSGNLGNDLLDGGLGKDLLDGGLGQDTLLGGAGRDTLTGGPGNDCFVYSDLSDSSPTPRSRDLITDFRPGDRIDLSLIDADASQAGDQSFTFIGAAPFTAPGQLSYAISHGVGLLMANVTGGLEADFQIQLRRGAVLHTESFAL